MRGSLRGQLVVHLLCDLRRTRLGIRATVGTIEAAVIESLAGLGVAAYGKPAALGVYVLISGTEAKIAALGLRVRNGCTYHGLAVNIAMDLAPFADIDPSGYRGLEFGLVRVKSPARFRNSMHGFARLVRIAWWRIAVAAFAAGFMVPQAALAQIPAPVTFVQFPGQTLPGLGGTGTFLANPEVRPVNIAHPERPVALGMIKPVDTQGNGRPDLFVCHAMYPPDDPIPQPCRFLRPQADGSLVEVTRKLLGPGPLPARINPGGEVSVADFNRDGLPDIFIAAGGYDAPPYPGEPNVLLLSNGDGTYTDRSSTLPPVSDFTHSACVGDVNGDGYLDIYAGNVDNRIKPYFLLGNGDGTFTQTKRGLPTSIADLVDSYTSCLLADLDRDGHLDLVLGYFAGLDGRPQENLILWNDGAGDFTKRPHYALPPSPLGSNNFIVLDIDVLDANRDGRPDLLVMSSSKVGATGFNLQMLINRGDGTFADETAARIGPSALRPSGPYCALITLADFNGDGFEDFYCDTLYDQSGRVETVPRYWLNNRIGGWTPIEPDSLPAGLSSIIFIHIVDFAGDGSQDLVKVGAVGGDLWYSSFRNVTVRTVPSEPVIRRAAAGDAQASISFTPPLASGASPITGYTATCALGTFGSGLKAAGVASPITVSGLTNGRAYACSVTATSAAGTSLPSRALSVRPFATILDLNQHGLTGSWYEPATSGQGVEVEVFPNPSSGTGSAFVSWFTYDTVGGGAERQRWYTAQGQVVTGQLNAALTVYQNTGGNFNAPPVTNAQAVGTATLSFSTCTSGQLTYSFTDGTGRTGTIPLTRLTHNVTCSTMTPSPTNADFALSGNWYNPATSGQGFTVEVNPSSGALFAAWYTYLPNGTAAGAAGQRWYTAQAAFTPGLRSMPLTLYETTGGVFDTPTPPGQNTMVVGTGTMAFQSCSAATFSYNFTGGSSNGASGTIALQRAGPVPAGCAP